jgi:hypothetical protein
MTACLQFFLGLKPVIEVKSVDLPTLDVNLVRPHLNLLERRLIVPLGLIRCCVFSCFLMPVHNLALIEAVYSGRAWLVSPLTLLAPSKPRLILSRIVWIKIDVEA